MNLEQLKQEAREKLSQEPAVQCRFNSVELDAVSNLLDTLIDKAYMAGFDQAAAISGEVIRNFRGV